MKGGTSWHQACLHPDHHSSSAKTQGAGGMPCAAVLSTLDVSLVILWPGPRTGSLLASPPHRPRGPLAWTTCPQGSHVTPANALPEGALLPSRQKGWWTWRHPIFLPLPTLNVAIQPSP